MTEDVGLRARLLNEVFGGLRAEYFREDIFDLFAEPTYWPELLTRRPCLLVGGRGTGKTTVLRGLSYEGQRRLTGDDVSHWSHIGLYWRVDTSMAAAFRGAGLSELDWTRAFGHYTNIILAQNVIEFVHWFNSFNEREVQINASNLRRFNQSLMIDANAGLGELSEALDDALVDFEVALNNVNGKGFPALSVLGRPLAYLCRALQDDKRINGKPIFFLIDEYENLEDYQQRAINTLIKHAGDEQYTFKVGMKATGHRERATINPNEVLVEPADYAVVDISERLKAANYAEFASKVCMGRLRRMTDSLGEVTSIRALMPTLSDEAEAELLGVHDRNRDIRRELERLGADQTHLNFYDKLSPLSEYMIAYWARTESSDVLSVLRDAKAKPGEWANRLNNYQHASLYTIRRRKGGIRKYFSGWDTFIALSDGNIRYLLQLVNEALQLHLGSDQRTLSTPISPRVQTEAAQAVGQRLVEQLQGLAPQGADLTRLVLGLGRIFQVMAAEPEGHTPEVSQFRVRIGSGAVYDAFAEDLLTAAIMHLAVRTFPGDKMASTSGETRETNYQLHPIFAPFFVFSYRSKRRMQLDTKELHGLVRHPRPTISAILRKSDRGTPDELPEQMSLFQDYFG